MNYLLTDVNIGIDDEEEILREIAHFYTRLF